VDFNSACGFNNHNMYRCSFQKKEMIENVAENKGLNTKNY
jgi:hypothetical protein